MSSEPKDTYSARLEGYLVRRPYTAQVPLGTSSSTYRLLAQAAAKFRECLDEL